MRNSVLRRRLALGSPALRMLSIESTSSMKMTAGLSTPQTATAKSVRTIFSPSSIHLLNSEDAEIEKNVAPDWCAMAFPIRAFVSPPRSAPVPGGPNSSKPLGSALRPTKISGRSMGQHTTSTKLFFANSRPAIWSN
ncbi:unnamed protein product, partial [Ascophyllum nodosum]